MDIKKISIYLLVTGGFIELVIAIMHFIWPFNFIQLPDFDNVSVPIKDFILLASLAIGLCMTIFACLSFYFAKRVVYGEKSAMIFSLTQAILWIFRLIFEILLPVRVPLYSIKNPSGIIIIGVTFIILIYLVPAVLIRKTIRTL
jgi:hypothetical protein